MLENLQVRHKLMLIMMGICIVSLFLSGAAFFVHDKQHLKQMMVQELSVLAKVIADRSTAALTFDDISLAEENLAALSAKQSIIDACILKINGQVFATYSRTSIAEKDWPTGSYKELTYQFQDDTFLLFLPIILENNQIGIVFLRSDLEELHDRSSNQIRVTLIITLVVSLVAFFLSSRLHFIISKPISQLAQTAKDVAEHNDYSLRVESLKSHDELGSLVEAFNNMLARIQTRDDDLRKSEQGFRLLVEASPVAVAIMDENENFIHLNKKFLGLFGYTMDEMASVNDWWPLAYPEEGYRQEVRDKWQKRIEDAIKDNTEIVPQEAIVTCKDGIKRHIMFQASIIGTRVIVILNDLTERIDAEKEKENLEKRLKQAQKMEAIGTLAGGIAHDFNNILSVILGYSEMVKDDMPSHSKHAEDLGKVVEASNRAKELVKQILAFSRQAEIDRIPLQLQSLIKEALKMLRSSIPTTIDIQDDIDSKCGVVLADPTQVHQILMNLCTNANQAMADTGGILNIELKSIRIDKADRSLGLNIASGEYVELLVSDTGCGIGSDVIDKIFDPYFTTKEVGKGTGMGLAIIHGIISDYGGGITVESKIGQGATFHVYFPVVEKEELPLVNDVERIQLGTERVLFIDDEEFLAQMGHDMLERLGYNVTVRSNSLDALVTFQNNPNEFDVIITDQTMPGMTGADLARRMLQIRPDIPIILCTGYSNLIDEESAKAMGIKEFALKPLTKKVIAKLIRKVLSEKGHLR